jgi:hypothetical protein
MISGRRFSEARARPRLIWTPCLQIARQDYASRSAHICRSRKTVRSILWRVPSLYVASSPPNQPGRNPYASNAGKKTRQVLGNSLTQTLMPGFAMTSAQTIATIHGPARSRPQAPDLE